MIRYNNLIEGVYWYFDWKYVNMGIYDGRFTLLDSEIPVLHIDNTILLNSYIYLLLHHQLRLIRSRPLLHY